MEKKNLTNLKVNGQNISLAGRIVAVSAAEYSAYTNVTYYCPEGRGTDRQGNSDFRTEAVLDYAWRAEVNCSQKIRTLYWNEKDGK